MDSLLFVFWDPDPSIFGLPFRWYGLLFAAAFFFGYILMDKIFKHEKIKEGWLDSLTIYMALSTVIGARLGHCFFYEPEYYLAHPLEIPQVWKGGLASHGAAIGIITGMVLWSRRISKRSVFWALDRVVIMVALSGLFIRSGNLMNSEIVGAPTESSIGFIFPQHDQPDQLRVKPIGESNEIAYVPKPQKFDRHYLIARSKDEQHYQFLQGKFILRAGAKEGFKAKDVSPGEPLKTWYTMVRTSKTTESLARTVDSTDQRRAVLINHLSPDQSIFEGAWVGDDLRLKFANTTEGNFWLLESYDQENWTLISRASLDPQHNVIDTTLSPEAGKEVHYMVVNTAMSSLLLARHPAQIYEAVSYFLVFLFLYFLYWRMKGKVPYGLFFGYFLVLVFSARFIIEFMKEIQTEFAANSPLNMGQILSIPFVLAGFFFIWRAYSKGKQQMTEEVGK